MKGNIKSVLRIIKELSFIFNAKQKKRAYFVLLTIVIGSGFELLGVTAILPFVEAVTAPDTMMENQYVQGLAGIFRIHSSNELLIWMGIGLIVIYIVKNIYILYSNYVQFDYSTRIEKELSIKMLHSYMSRPYTYFLNVNSSEIMRGCNEDIAGVYTILSNAFGIIAETVNVTVIGIFLIYMDPVISLSVIGLMVLAMLGIILFFKPVMKRMGKKNMRAKQLKYKALYQTINSVKELYVMQRQDLFLREYDEAADSVRQTQKKYEFINSAPDRIIEGVCVGGLIGIVVIRLLTGVEMASFIPKLGAFAMAAFKILPSIGKISSRMTSVVYNLPMLENVYHMVETAEECDRIRAGRRKAAGITKEIRFREKVSVDHISWKYENQNQPVLKDVAFEIRKGESVALIGESGAGKTTLSDVLLGLLQPQKGNVFMDGMDVYGMPEAWAQIVGYVPQSVFLLDDTVRKNIAFGLEVADDREIWYALEQAQLKTFVESLPEGLDTVVGERGIKFSGGQKQRIAIARALYNQPELLVLDEATAALDTETETAVMESIEALQGQITMIIVAHRLSTIRNCDKIYEVRNGAAVQRTKDDIFGRNADA